MYTFLLITIILFDGCLCQQNLAYKKPAYQSSYWSYYSRNFTADRAVDDDKGTYLWNGACSHTFQQNDSDWFVLDLGDKYFIDYILLLGRNERVDRMDYFLVGLTNNFSSQKPPIRGTYELCGQFPKKAGASENMKVDCFYQNKANRYIIIQTSIGKSGEITICNLEVYGSKYRNTSYVGCFSSLPRGVRRDLKVSDENNQQHLLCVDECRRARTTYAALKEDICYCGNEAENSLPSSTCFAGNSTSPPYFVYTSCLVGLFGTDCDKVCHCANETQCSFDSGKCPNLCANNWMGISCNISKGSYNNCGYTKNKQNNFYSNFSSLYVNNDNCVSYCVQNGFVFSGTENDTCSCSFEVNNLDFDTPNYCTYRCLGNTTQYCGQKDYKTLYNVCPANYIGYKCQYECHCKFNSDCSYPDGTCSSGCAKGWMGHACHIRNCSDKQSKCGHNEECHHFENNYSICDCKIGFQKSHIGGPCEDIDECRLRIDTCNRSTEDCFNLPGFFNCSCKTGYQLNITGECIDIDECILEETMCNITTHVCRNKVGSFDCFIMDAISKQANTSLIGMILLGLALLFLAVIIAVFTLIYIRKRRKNLSNIAETNNSENNKKINNSFKKINNNISIKKADAAHHSRPLVIAKNSSPVYVEMSPMNMYLKDFPDFYDNNKATLEVEFRNIPEEMPLSCDYGKQKIFKEKNRFKNVAPYDDNRVKLQILNEDYKTDYINASYINFSDYNNIIATQGPNKNTIVDFWRMIDEQNCEAIIMLCNITENDKIKCNQYWPIEDSVTYGTMQIQLLEETTWPEYKCRKFRLEKENGGTKEVLQWHYVSWPDHGVPTCAASLLHFIKRFRNAMKSSGKAVIHCSAGIGRTGCLLMVDRLLNQARHGLPLDVAKCLCEFRQQRPQLVQTKAQYNLIFECLATEALLGCILYSLDEFKAYFNQRNLSNVDNHMINQLNMINEDNEKKTVKKIKNSTSSATTHHLIESSMSLFSFQICIGIKFDDFWSQVTPTCRRYIILCDEKNRFNLDKHRDSIGSMFKISEEESKNYGGHFKLIQLDGFSSIYENQETAIYANSLNPDDVSPIDFYYVHLSQTTEVNFQQFSSIFEALLTSKDAITLMSMDPGLSTLFASAFQVLETMAWKKEVSIFQIVQQLSKTFPLFHMTHTMYINLYNLAMKYIHSETCLPWI